MGTAGEIELEGKSVLVTGGCGFMGSEVVKQLSQLGAQVTVLDNLSSGKEFYIRGYPAVRFVKGDLTDDDVLIEAMKGTEYVLHLAALPFIPDSYYYPKDFFNVNVNATISLALASVKHGIKKLVYVSSSEVYGSAQYMPMDENHPTLPQSTLFRSPTQTCYQHVIDRVDRASPSAKYRPETSLAMPTRPIVKQTDM